MALFSLFALLDPDDAYRTLCRRIVQERLAGLVDGLGIELPDDPQRAGYYAVLDLEAWARRTHGDEFMAWATREHVPLDIVYGLARNFGTVLLNGDGFGGPPWSARVSLANLPTDSYREIGRHVATGAARAVDRWRASRKKTGERIEVARGKGPSRRNPKAGRKSR